jgi:hypothetical protein
MWHEAMPPCDIYNSHAGLQTLCHNPRLQIIRPASASPSRLDHLETPNKPITTICHTKSSFVSGDFLADTSSVRNPHNQWGGDGAYASLLFGRGYTILRVLRKPNLVTLRLGLERFNYAYDPPQLSFLSRPPRA